MKLPQSILERLRGPMVAMTLAGCSTSPGSAPVEPAPPPAGPVHVRPHDGPQYAGRADEDPVPYDPALERERLARVDHARAADQHRRERRIEDREPRDPFGQIGVIGRRLDLIHAACGRG